MYQKLISLRKSFDVFRTGKFTLLCPEDEKVFAYTRDTDKGHLLVVCNFSDGEVAFEWPGSYRSAQKLIANYPDTSDTLRPYEAVMLYYED